MGNMEYIVILAKEGKIEKVDFLHGGHKKMWGILGEWEGDTKNLCKQEYYSIKKKHDIIMDMGYDAGDIVCSCFACKAKFNLAVDNLRTFTCDACPLKWTDKYGNPSDNCNNIYFAWQQETGEEKKRLARMIKDMPLKDEAELFYNIVE